jgi:nucleotide-binding universal stress UspA family protein
VTTSTPSGHPGSETVHRAAADGADLIVVGAGNHRWLERVLLGSVSTRVLHTADTSVMVVHAPPASLAPAQILLAVDGSHGATTARRAILALLDPSAVRVTVEAVAAYAFPSFTGPGVGYATGGFTPAIEAELTAEAEREATTAAAWLRDAGFDASAVWEMGPAAATLLTRAAAMPAALVVVGSRGLGPVDRAVLGSVSDELARQAGATLVAR